MTKYELIRTDMVSRFGEPLYRIRALIDIPMHEVKAGDLGGYIADEHNLSHEGNAWISSEVHVFGRVRVYGDRHVYDNTWVFGQVRRHSRFRRR